MQNKRRHPHQEASRHGSECIPSQHKALHAVVLFDLASKTTTAVAFQSGCCISKILSTPKFDFVACDFSGSGRGCTPIVHRSKRIEFLNWGLYRTEPSLIRQRW
eukprot:2631927-Amphidinium_carterae.1